jgi:hypothetical protein
MLTIRDYILTLAAGLVRGRSGAEASPRTRKPRINVSIGSVEGRLAAPHYLRTHDERPAEDHPDRDHL